MILTICLTIVFFPVCLFSVEANACSFVSLVFLSELPQIISKCPGNFLYGKAHQVPTFTHKPQISQFCLQKFDFVDLTLKGKKHSRALTDTTINVQAEFKEKK